MFRRCDGKTRQGRIEHGRAKGNPGFWRSFECARAVRSLSQPHLGLGKSVDFFGEVEIPTVARASKDLSKAIDNEAKAQSAFIDAYLNVLNQLNRR